ncbi:MAG TPA: VWA domain-containing protein, partial [Bryobacteraceae bacterium]|nr:VWA domain-containing protein [Bryobacteraceae bacterium]
GEDLAGMFGTLGDVAANEQIHEMRFEDGMRETSQMETYRYLVTPSDELRVDPATGAPSPAPTAGFLVLSHFENLLRYLLPQVREESRFRSLGRAQVAGHDSWVVAFARRDGNGQGLVWIDAASHQVVRLRVDLAAPIHGSPLESLTTDVAFVAIKFPSTGSVLWLPARVTAHGRYEGGELHSVHRYSDYRLAGSQRTGVPAAAGSNTEDPWEMLDRSIAMAGAKRTAESIALLRQALRFNPEMAPARYHLAATLSATGDVTGAEAELREALRRSPDLGPAHNFLGILLFKRGDLGDATAELRVSAQLQPEDATVHFNLAEALEKADPKAALDEYRIASTLAPDSAAFKARYANAAAARKPDGTTIKVEVRQVLVPVVVTDKEGHHVTGLSKADFRVFEDGVEQTIAAFSVENVGSGQSSAAATDAAEPTPVAVPASKPVHKPAEARRTYVICIDRLHTGFAGLVRAREALSKLFRTEQAGDARYVVVALGTTTEVVQAPTTDPAAVLKAIESKDFEKLFLGDKKGATGSDIQAFRRELDVARRACDESRPECAPLKTSLPFRAAQIAAQERAITAAFLEQLRYLVQDLARESGRRTLVLISDGFPLLPGKQVLDLLEAYFPDSGNASYRENRKADLDAVLRVADRQNIPIYTIDSRGLHPPDYFGSAGMPGPVQLATTNSLNTTAYEGGGALEDMAAATGGIAYKNNNDLFAGLARAFADGRQYYVLAYVPRNASSDGTFRAISVLVRDGKLSVNAKRGYWAAGNSDAD